jgi:hypothetical protein
VCHQVRPLSTKELIQDEAKSCVQVAPNGVKNQLIIGADKKFTFDHVIGPEEGQSAIYDGCVKPLVESCLAGYNSCILAYGQTVGTPLVSRRKLTDPPIYLSPPLPTLPQYHRTPLTFAGSSCIPYPLHLTSSLYDSQGSGKTHTMGSSEWMATDESDWGVIPTVCKQIFDAKQAHEAAGTAEIAVTCSFLELYNENFKATPRPRLPPPFLPSTLNTPPPS